MNKRRINVGRKPKSVVQEPAPVIDLPDVEIVLNHVAFTASLSKNQSDYFQVQHRGLVPAQFLCSFINVAAKDHVLIFGIDCSRCGETVAPGCDRLMYVATPYDAEEHHPEKTAWSATYRRKGGGLIDVFYRCHSLVPDHPVFNELGKIVTFAPRDLTKCRFTGFDYFIPYSQFLYIGTPYR